MVAQKLIKRSKIGVSNVIELEDISSDIIAAGNEGNNSILELCALMMRTGTLDR